MSKRVLITGICGFTGMYMAAHMVSQGYTVFGVGTQALQENQGDFIYQQVNLLDLLSVKKVVSEVRPNIVIHLAAIAFVNHGNASDFYNINIMGTRNLLEALSESNFLVEHILLASSANVYGNTQISEIDELVNPSPANDYAVSKLAMEYMAKIFMNKLPITIVRPFNYTGVGQSLNFLVPKIVSHFVNKAEYIELGNLDVSRDFSDVRGLVRAYRLLCETTTSIGLVVNVSSGFVYSLNDIIEMCEDISQHHLDVRVNPAFVRANEVKVLRGDNSLLKSLISEWEMPLFKDTLKWMIGSK